MVIANVQTVYDVNQYCKYWRDKINQRKKRFYAVIINIVTLLGFYCSLVTITPRNIRLPSVIFVSIGNQ